MKIADMEMLFKTVLLIAAVCAARLAYGGDTEFGEAYRRSKCCSNNWEICCQPHPWERDPDTPWETLFCDTYLKAFSGDSKISNCISSYKLMADMKINRNKIFEFNRCSSNKDQPFIDNILEGQKTHEANMSTALRRCCTLDVYSSSSNVFKELFLQDRRLKAIDAQYNQYRSDSHQNSDCSKYRSFNIKDDLQTAILNMGLFKECARHITCV